MCGCRIHREEPVHTPLLPQKSPAAVATDAPVIVVGRSGLHSRYVYERPSQCTHSAVPE